MTTLHGKILCLVALLAAFVFPSFASDCSNGGSCGGGANFVGDELVETYLKRRAVKTEKRNGKRVKTAARDYVRTQTKNALGKIRALLPEFSAELAAGIDGLDWYFVDKPLTDLPFSRTEIPFESAQGAVQVGRKVYLDEEIYDRVAAKDKKEALKTLLHELVRRIQLRGEATNYLLTPSSVFDATDLLVEAVDGKVSAQELKEKLRQAGFRAEGIVAGPEPIEIKADLVAKFENPMDVQMKLPHPISLRGARKALANCLTSSDMSTFHGQTLVGKMLAPHVDWKRISPGMGVYDDPEYTDGPLPSITPTLSRSFYNYPEDNKMGGWGKAMDESERKMHRVSAWAWINWGLSANPSFTVGIKDKAADLELIPAGAFPKIHYQPMTATERLLDGFGQANGEMKIEKIAFSVERNQYEQGQLLPLKNRKSGAETEMSVDPKSFIYCVQNQLTMISAQEKLSGAAIPAYPPAVLQGGRKFKGPGYSLPKKPADESGSESTVETGKSGAKDGR